MDKARFSEQEPILGVEKGQSAVLLALAMVGLLAFAALALDGGIVYSDRRGAQNAADTAALAGALAKLSSPNWEHAALSRAASNGYDNHGTTIVRAYSPPISGPYASDDDYVQVVITSTPQTSLLQFAFGGVLRNTVEAVARARPAQNIGGSYALFGASPDACKTIFFQGTQATRVSGGGIFSNSTASTQNCASGVQGGSGDIVVTGGGIEVAGTFNINGGSGQVSPPPTEFVPQRDLPEVPIPDCSGLRNWGDVNINEPTNLEPGIYGDIKITGNPKVVVTMSPGGMYCVTGIHGFTSTGAGKLLGSGVMIYLERGPFDMGGNFMVQITPPTDLVDASNNQWAKMLMYAAPTNTSTIGIRGTTYTQYSGTIYAKSSACELEGTGNTFGISAQVICNTIKLSGNAEMTITFDPEDNYMLPSLVELSQ